MSKSVKIFALVVLGLAGLIAIFSMMGDKGSVSETEGPLASSGVSQPIDLQSGTIAPTGEFASMLASISSISIDETIFSNPAYKALRDHPINVGTDIVGRSNPFAPVGTDGADLSSAPTVQMLQPGKITSTTAEFSAQVSFSTTAPVSVVFQYGTSDQFGSVTTPVVMTKSGTAVVTVSSLAPNTTYYVQAVAVVGSTTSNGTVMTFTTTTPPATR